MKILKRNQIIISVLALMLITVGYMSYTSNLTNTVETGALMDAETMAGIGDAKFVNSNNVVEDDSENTKTNTKNVQEEAESEEKKETAQSAINTDTETTDKTTETTAESSTNSTNSTTSTTSATIYGTEYFATSKLERDKMYSQMMETYKSLAENTAVPAEQKGISTQEITKINNQKSSIMIAENLIKNLGFEDVVIFVNDNSTSVIVKAENLSEADIAKIQNIVCREIGVEVGNIHISTKSVGK